MIRIIGKRKSEQPKKELDKTAILILQLLGIVVASQPDTIKGLLENYGLKLSEHAQEAELIENLFKAISRKDQEFNAALSLVMISSILEKTKGQKDTEEDNFNYAEAITGALGTIGSAVGQHLKNKGDKDQLTGQTMQQMLAYKQQRQLNETPKTDWIKTAAMLFGGLVLVGLGLWGISQYKKPSIANTIKP